MTTELCIEIHMLGEFSITYNDKVLSDNNKQSKKCWYLLEYLIANRHNQVSQNDLIELLWPEDTSENPIGALKTLLHRVRNLLVSLGLPKELIGQTRGTYFWNNEYACVVDAEEFERLYKETHLISDPQSLLSHYEEMFKLYKGYFLPQTLYEPWVLPVNAYYHTIYLKVINEYIQLLLKQKDYIKVSSICCKALTIDNYDEDLHYYLIYSLYKLEKHYAAIEQYNQTITLLMKKYNITPSKRFTSLYTEILSTNKTPENNLISIRNHLIEKPIRDGALFCEYPFFQELCHLEQRFCIRNNSPLYLCLITVSNKFNGKLEENTINKAMSLLSDSIMQSLRAIDIFTKYSMNQFLLLLPGTKESGGKQIINRISEHYYKTNHHSITKLECHMVPIDLL